jgi:hypothetical protein
VVDTSYLRDNKELLERLRTLPTLKDFEEKDLRGTS